MEKRGTDADHSIIYKWLIDCLSKKPCDEVMYACFEQKMLPKLSVFKITECDVFNAKSR